jgi:hypothetical protein
VALGPSEAWVGGFVVDTTTGLIATTTSKTGATWQAGFLRDPDGRLVVTYG